MSAPANSQPPHSGANSLQVSKDEKNHHRNDEEVDDEEVLSEIEEDEAAEKTRDPGAASTQSQEKHAHRQHKRKEAQQPQAAAQNVQTSEFFGCTFCCNVYRGCVQLVLSENEFSENRCKYCWCPELVSAKDEPTLQALQQSHHPSAQQLATVHTRLEELQDVKFPTTDEPGCTLTYIPLGDVRKFRPKSLAACVYCHAAFKASEIVDVIPERDGTLTAMCPNCSVDAVVEVQSPRDFTVEWYKTMAQHHQEGFDQVN